LERSNDSSCAKLVAKCHIGRNSVRASSSAVRTLDAEAIALEAPYRLLGDELPGLLERLLPNQALIVLYGIAEAFVEHAQGLLCQITRWPIALEHGDLFRIDLDWRIDLSGFVGRLCEPGNPAYQPRKHNN